MTSGSEWSHLQVMNNKETRCVCEDMFLGNETSYDTVSKVNSHDGYTSCLISTVGFTLYLCVCMNE